MSVVTPDHAKYCEKLGQTRVTTQSKVGIFTRDDKKVHDEPGLLGTFHLGINFGAVETRQHLPFADGIANIDIDTGDNAAGLER